MFYPRFKCSADFPSRSPGLLTSHGFIVTTGEWIRGTSSTKEFGYWVSDGACKIVITGGTLPEGFAAYLVALPPKPDFRFWLRSRNRALRERVQTILHNAGGVYWHDQPNS